MALRVLTVDIIESAKKRIREEIKKGNPVDLIDFEAQGSTLYISRNRDSVSASAGFEVDGITYYLGFQKNTRVH